MKIIEYVISMGPGIVVLSLMIAFLVPLIRIGGVMAKMRLGFLNVMRR